MGYFIYDDKSMEDIIGGDVKLMIGTLETNNEIESNFTKEIIKGSISSSHTVANHLTTRYSDVANFKIFLFKELGFAFTREEAEEITDFLFSKKIPKWLDIKNADGTTDILYKGIFTDATYLVNGKDVCGINLTFTADSPYGWSELLEITKTVYGSEELVITLPNYLEDSLYPILLINEGTYGETVEIYNEDTDCRMTFKISTFREMSFDCQNCIVLSNDEVADYENIGWSDNESVISWLNLRSGDNHITITGNGTFTFKYRIPQKKVRIL